MTDKQITKILRPELEREIHAKIDQVKDYADEQKEKTADLIKEHPFLAVGGALVSGLLIGLLVTRRRN